MIVMTPDATEEHIASVRKRLETVGVHVLVLPGELTTAIGAIGDPQGVAELGLEGMPGRNPLIAYVVDDVPEPRKVRGIEIRGRAEIHTTGGEEILKGADPQFIRLRPIHIASWGIESDGLQAVSRNVDAPRG
jgi:hypothetical protein